jgi:tetratricopeptide (TPR) repeat protein
VVWRILRYGVILTVAGGVVFVAASFGRGPAAAAGVLWLFILGATAIWLPRAAHRAFRRGDYKRARLHYNILRRLQLDPVKRTSVEVSLAACVLGYDDWEGALVVLDRIDPDGLGEAARAAWLNNRAYAIARVAEEPELALELANEAIALRPDVAGFRHTRGIALLELGRLDEAIRELDGLWKRLGEYDSSPLLEAERCYDLGQAWTRKGEREYASDYFERAHRAAPESTWARLSGEYLAPMSTRSDALAEFIEA